MKIWRSSYKYNYITAIHDNISHTKYLNTSYFLKILLKNSDRYGGTLAYIIQYNI